MNARNLVGLLVVGLCFASTTAGAEDSNEEPRQTSAERGPNYTTGRFLVDGVFQGIQAPTFTHGTSFPSPFVRARYQFNRYFAIEQMNGAQPPVVMVYSVGARGQLPLPRSWSLFTTARVGIEHVVLDIGLRQRSPGFKEPVIEGGIGVERLTDANVLYGLEIGGAKFFSGPLENRTLVPQFRLNLGYAF